MPVERLDENLKGRVKANLVINGRVDGTENKGSFPRSSAEGVEAMSVISDDVYYYYNVILCTLSCIR
jgi:hypothetical protein